MHIDPGFVTGAKLVLSYVTCASVGAIALTAMAGLVRRERVAIPVFRSAMATACVLAFFELLPHWPVGVSEVHFILGSTLFLIFGTAPAAFGLAAGLLIQGLVFAPLDLPQYGINVTTLLAPLFAMAILAHRILAPGTPTASCATARPLSYPSPTREALWAGWPSGRLLAKVSRRKTSQGSAPLEHPT